ncbi:MAG: SBBP repeat-containing protein [Gammaproteobacteria bacterium]|nr:SBBP repeat-containing protein [Gammaproteobacteria bacterium]
MQYNYYIPKLLLICLLDFVSANLNAADMASYLGGAQYDTSRGMVTDAAGNIYITGWTFTQGLAVSNDALQNTHHGNADAFVARFTPDGATLEYLTYYGGGGNDNAQSIALDTDGNIYVVGTSTSDDLATVNPVRTELNGGSDAFIIKIDAAGNLVFASYFGGSGSETAAAMHVDNSGRIYFAGHTTSTDLISVVQSFDTSCGSDGLCDASDVDDPATRQSDGFIASLALDSQQMYVPEYSTYIGGDGIDGVHDLAVDPLGTIYITGETNAGDFPYKNAFLSTRAGGFSGGYDAYVMVINPQLVTDNGLVYSSYIGGDGEDSGKAIAVSATGIVTIAGDTSSTDFPVTSQSLQSTYRGGTADSFIAQFDITQLTGASLQYASYIGGSGEDLAIDLYVDAAGDVYLLGGKESVDLLSGSGAHYAYDDSVDGFIVKIDQQTKLIEYFSYFGSYSIDWAFAMTVDQNGKILITGESESDDLATNGVWQTQYAGNTDAFTARLDPAQAASKPVAAAPESGGGSFGIWLVVLLLTWLLYCGGRRNHQHMSG